MDQHNSNTKIVSNNKRKKVNFENNIQESSYTSFEQLLFSFIKKEGKTQKQLTPKEGDWLYLFGRNPLLSLAELISLFYTQKSEILLNNSKMKIEKDTSFENSNQNTTNNSVETSQFPENNQIKQIPSSFPFKIIDISEYGIIIRTNYPVNIKPAGALLKRAKIIHNYESNNKQNSDNTKTKEKKELYQVEINSIKNLEEIVKKIFSRVFVEDKGVWTISVYESYFKPKAKSKNTTNYKSFAPSLSKELQRLRDKFLTIIKKEIKRQSIKKTIYSPPQDGTQYSPQRMVRKSIIKQGFEFIIWSSPRLISFAITDEVLNPKIFDKRDMNRPKVRPLLILGVALARTMVNIGLGASNIINRQQSIELEIKNSDISNSNISNSEILKHNFPNNEKTDNEKKEISINPCIIYDPFCGSGTILQEAWLRGCGIIGTDIDPKCIDDTITNLDWIKRQRHIIPQELKDYSKAIRKINKINEKNTIIIRKYRNFQVMDITQPEFSLFKEIQNIPLILVTEPDLQTPLETYPSPGMGKDIMRKFSRQYHYYLDGLEKISNYLKTKNKKKIIFVMVFPRLHLSSGKRISLRIPELLERHNFRIFDFPLGKSKFIGRFLHAWKEPIIEREIVVFFHL